MPSTQALDWFVKLFQEEHPEVDVGVGSVARDLLAKPLADVLTSYHNDNTDFIDNYTLTQSIDDISDDTMDSIAANFFVTRRTGSNAYGTIRIFLSLQKDLAVTTSYTFTTGSMAFNPTQSYSVKSSSLTYDSVTGYYYYDIAVVSTQVGADYNLSTTDETYSFSVSPTIPYFALATSAGTFTGGTSRETNQNIYDRIISTISNRELSSDYGAQALIEDNYPAATTITPVSSGSLMVRDQATSYTAWSSLVSNRVCTKENSTTIKDTDFNLEYSSYDTSNINNISFIGPYYYGMHTVTSATVASDDLTVKFTPQLPNLLEGDIKYTLHGRAAITYHTGGKSDIWIGSSLSDYTYTIEDAKAINIINSTTITYPMFIQNVYLSGSSVPMSRGVDYSIDILDTGKRYSSDESGSIILRILDSAYVGYDVIIEYKSTSLIESIQTLVDDSGYAFGGVDTLIKAKIPLSATITGSFSLISTQYETTVEQVNDYISAWFDSQTNEVNPAVLYNEIYNEYGVILDADDFTYTFSATDVDGTPISITRTGLDVGTSKYTLNDNEQIATESISFEKV